GAPAPLSPPPAGGAAPTDESWLVSTGWRLRTRSRPVRRGYKNSCPVPGSLPRTISTGYSTSCAGWHVRRSAAGDEEAAEGGEPDRDQKRAQGGQHRQGIRQVAGVAHPDVGEEGGANRGGQDDDGGDDRRPLLVLDVERDRSPARQPKQPGGGQPVEDQGADQGADRDANPKLHQVAHHERRRVDDQDTDRRDDADGEQHDSATQVAAKQPITLTAHQVTDRRWAYPGCSHEREASTSRQHRTASETSP